MGCLYLSTGLFRGKNELEFAEVSALNTGAKIYYCSRRYSCRFTKAFGSRSSARGALCRAAEGGGKRGVWPEGNRQAPARGFAEEQHQCRRFRLEWES